MKRQITLLFLAAASVFTVRSQVLIQEDFTAPFTPATAGWVTLNNSSPVGSLGWFQGNGAGVFPAFNGSPNDYYAANFNSQGAAAGGISNWLMTPTVTIYNGGVLQFATRVDAGPIAFPDRLQVLMSSAGNATAIPSGTASVGTFTTLLLDINPNLTTNVATAVNNGSVNGYPDSWTVFTIPITGVTGTVTGRFAFRYLVDDAGPNGNNGDYIGLDAVKYSLPCNPAVNSQTICAGVTTTLVATGGNANTTYSWNNGATTSSIAVTPAATTVYTLFPSNGTITCGNSITATVTIGANLSINVASSVGNATICTGTPVTFTASGAAATYSWNTGAMTPVITVTPNATTTYSVGGLAGVNCVGLSTITVNTKPSPTLGVVLTPSPICLGGSITINASGANTYTYLGSNNNPQSTATPTDPGAYFFTLSGSNANGCTSSGIVQFTVNPSPTVNIAVSKVVLCLKEKSVLTASGADTYTWSGAVTSTATSLSFTGTATGPQVFTAVGTSSDGCTASASVTLTVNACTGIEKPDGINTHVFPNPFTNQITLSGIEGKVEIYNMLGQLVISVKTNNESTVNTTELVKGAYVLKAYDNEGSLIKTINLMKQ